jgi:uncharacterized protein YbjT (DUF2867 family)
MTTLVTGATGRIGSRFVPRLLDTGREVRVLARDATRADSLRERGAAVVVGDLADRAAVRRALEGADSLVHLAASFRGVAEDEIVAV